MSAPWRRAAATSLLLVLAVTGWFWWLGRDAEAPGRVLSPEPASTAPDLGADCPKELHGFFRCVRAAMPKKHSQAFSEVPLPAFEALRAAAAGLLSAPAGSCELTLPEPLRERYAITALSAGDRRLCALWERSDAGNGQARGWGTLIVNGNASRSLVLGAPHPLFDLGTAQQAVELLVAVDARALVLAGSHRHANAPTPACGAAPADASHSRSGYLALAAGVAEALEARAQPWWYLEWHGMREPLPGQPCFDAGTQRPVDVYVTEGSSRSLTAHGLAGHLAEALRRHQPGWQVATPDEGAVCNKSGSANQLGLHLNGLLPDPAEAGLCRARAGGRGPVTGTFVHIEQLRCATGGDCPYARSIRRADAWQAAIVDAYATATGQVAAPRQEQSLERSVSRP